MSSILINDESIMVFNPKLAQLLGLNESIVLNQIHYWLERSNNILEDRSWVYNSYEEWHKQISFLSTSTIKKTIKRLEDMKIVLSGNFNKSKMDKTKWYTIDYDVLEQLFKEHKKVIEEKDKGTIRNKPMEDQNKQSIKLESPEDTSNLKQPIPYNTTEITHTDDNDKGSLREIITFYSENIRLPGGYELERFYWRSLKILSL